MNAPLLDGQVGVIIALMIGELRYMPTLNRISTAIVGEAAALWRQCPSALLVCESEPMRQHALRLGVPADRLRTLPQPHGHKTRLVAEWLSAHRREFPDGPWTMCTHTLHAARAQRMLAKLGLDVVRHDIHVPFDESDADWKLRSERWFRFHNVAADVYCRFRAWL